MIVVILILTRMSPLSWLWSVVVCLCRSSSLFVTVVVFVVFVVYIVSVTSSLFLAFSLQSSLSLICSCRRHRPCAGRCRCFWHWRCRRRCRCCFRRGCLRLSHCRCRFRLHCCYRCCCCRSCYACSGCRCRCFSWSLSWWCRVNASVGCFSSALCIVEMRLLYAFALIWWSGRFIFPIQNLFVKKLQYSLW